MKLEKYTIKKGSFLYRFVKVEPSKCLLGMSKNKWGTGRCNLHNNIYYCARSINAIKIEFENVDLSSGSLIRAEVLEDIECGLITDAKTHKIFRGRVDGEEQKPVHSKLLSLFDYDKEVSYKETNKIAEHIIKKYPDGIAYSSVNGMDIKLDYVFLYVGDSDSDYGPCENIALTERGFSKIKQYPAERWPEEE